MKEFLALQKDVVNKAYKQLSYITDADASIKPGKGWSKKEIIGHLIDSAANNHQRFVRAQFTSDLIFTGYAQDDWVRVQNYQDANWSSLLELWKAYNLMLIHVLEHIPDEQLDKPRKHHNLQQFGFREAVAGEPISLGYVVSDYFAHMQHHLEIALKN
jgi:hypothetical protein